MGFICQSETYVFAALQPPKTWRVINPLTLMDSSALNTIPVADIDIGRFKYVLIKVYSKDPNQEHMKFIIRGYNWASFHADIYDKIQEELDALGLDTECVGGGRILHDSEKKSIYVYGYSMGFGLADHSKTV